MIRLNDDNGRDFRTLQHPGQQNREPLVHKLHLIPVSQPLLSITGLCSESEDLIGRVLFAIGAEDKG